MTEDEDIDGLAAEYVLGSLDAAERREVDARRKVDTALAGAIKAWEKRLGPLDDRVPGIEPPAHIFTNVANRLWGHGGQAIDIAEARALRRGVRRWRGLAVGASALAACLALVVVWLFEGLPGRPTAHPTTLVAVLQRGPAGTTADEITKSPGPPGFMVSVDLNARTIMASPVAARPVPRRSYQLWLIELGATTPSSLGVISQSEASTLPLRAPDRPADLTGATLAVSLEPEGGSPTGVPTGLIVFVGRLVPATP